MGYTPLIVVVAIIAIFISIIIVIWNVPKGNNSNPNLAGGIHLIKPKTLENASSRLKVDNDFIQYALEKINEDRTRFGLAPVVISDNQAAQAQALDLLKTKNLHASHWATNGMKPYMEYSMYGGIGYVEQNVAVRGYDNVTIDKCNQGAVRCTKINQYRTIDNEQRNMIYNDSKCCQNGHRDNILDSHHTHVSIGIASDSYYVAYVQNFENNYIKLNKSLVQDNNQIEISGQKLFGNYNIDRIGVYYDQMPTTSVYEQNKDKSSYKLGRLIASIAKPPPLFSKYQQPSNYTLIQADKWSENSQSIDIKFDLSPVLEANGVYTIVTYLKDNMNSTFPVMSYSVFAQ
jgi:uncharacterized protein YkwD